MDEAQGIASSSPGQCQQPLGRVAQLDEGVFARSRGVRLTRLARVVLRSLRRADIALIAAAVMLLPAVSSAKTAVDAWLESYNGPDNANGCAKASAMDTAGNVYVTGYTTNSDSGFDYATIAYSSAGVALWTNRYDGPGRDDDRAMA
ncbi:MAG: hypothetical protein FJ276_36180, partial [Planctomycetes bacterium]|nr:hypothetical protein [Planctomycetota bacterium]